MPSYEAPCVELGSAPETQSVVPSPSISERSSNSSSEPQNIRPPPLFRVLAMTPPEPNQPTGQEELERRLPGYRRIVIPRELTLIELLKQSSGVTTDEEVLRIRDVKLRVVAERVGLRRLHILAPRLRSLTLDGSAITSLRDLGIGLVRLRVLSINRCNLTSLDGIWGLSALRELHAAGNRIVDLHPLAVLQKLHTLNLDNNPITESSRLWTLGVCGSLRNLTLRGTPTSEAPDYRTRVTSVLQMLVSLDDRPLHNDIEYEGDNMFGNMSSSSDSEPEDGDLPDKVPIASSFDEPGPSTSADYRNELPPWSGPEGDVQSTSTDDQSAGVGAVRLRPRPATAECVGPRPGRPSLAPRPHTAHAHGRRAKPLTRLEIMNTLLDDEWRCSGSSLTSHGAVCGNLAQALRRTPVQRRHMEYGLSQAQMEMAELTMNDATRALASEIPRAPTLEDWTKFKQDTGIEIDIDFNQRPIDVDPMKAIERLEQIELETKERFERENYEKKYLALNNIDAKSDVTSSSADGGKAKTSISSAADTDSFNAEIWRGLGSMSSIVNPWVEVNAMFNDAASTQSSSDGQHHIMRDV